MTERARWWWGTAPSEIRGESTKQYSRQTLAFWGYMLENFQGIRKEFEPKGIPVFAISAVSGQGVKELLYAVYEKLGEIDDEPIVFEQEYFPEIDKAFGNEPYTVEYDEVEKEYVIEGPRIEKMLGYTNLESEKGFAFFQRFLKDNGILDQLEELGIQEGDTVRMYGLSFDYYK